MAEHDEPLEIQQYYSKWQEAIEQAVQRDDESLRPDTVPTRDLLKAQENSLLDSLTGLPNERHFQTELERFQDEVRRGKTTGAVVAVDMNNLKEVNDQMGGHLKGGDFLLKQLAILLKQNTSEQDFVSRLHGDEFAIIVRNITKGDMFGMLDRLQLAFVGGRDANGHLIPTVSMGVAHADDMGNEMSHITQCADFALYQAKDMAREGKKIIDTTSSGEKVSIRKPTAYRVYDSAIDGAPVAIPAKLLGRTP